MLTTVAAIVLDRAGTILSADAETERLCGRTGAELSGRALAQVLVTEGDRPRLEAALSSLTTAGAVRIELTLTRHEGAPLPAELTIVDGARLDTETVLVTIRDLSTQRVAEQLAVAGQAVIGAIARAHSPDEAMQALVAALSERMHWTGGTYWVIDTGDTLRAQATWPVDLPTPEHAGPARSPHPPERRRRVGVRRRARHPSVGPRYAAAVCSSECSSCAPAGHAPPTRPSPRR